MDLERAVTFPDWKRVLEAEAGLDGTTDSTAPPPLALGLR